MLKHFLSTHNYVFSYTKRISELYLDFAVWLDKHYVLNNKGNEFKNQNFLSTIKLRASGPKKHKYLEQNKDNKVNRKD